MRSRIKNLSRSIEAFRASLQAFRWVSGGMLLGTAFALAYWLPPVFRTEAHWREDLEAHWLLTLLVGCLLWAIGSCLVNAYRYAKLLPWLEQRLEQMQHRSGTE